MKRTKQKPAELKPKKKKVIKKPAEEISLFDQFISKYNFIILVGLIITVGIIAFRKYLSAEYLFFFKDIGSDSINQIYPSITHKINLLQEGFISKWSFYKGMGTNHYTGFPTEPYGWVRLLIDKIGYLVLGEKYFINGRFTIIFIFNYLLSGIIFYFYLRTLSIKKFSSLIGALILSFSGYMVLGSSWGFSGHIFRAVFLLFSFEQLFLKNRWYFFPFAIIFISNNLFILWLYSFFLFTYSIFRFTSGTDNNKFRNYIKLAGKMILLAIVGLLMNAVNIVRGFMKMYFSPRVAGSSSVTSDLQSGENIVDYSEHGSTMILRFFSNDVLGSGSDFNGWFNYFEAPVFYIGLISLLLFPQIFIFLKKRDKIIYGSFFGFWIMTLIFPYLRHAILGFTGDYYRFGFDFFIPFILLFFSIRALNESDKTFKLNYIIMGITLILLLIALFFPYKFTDYAGNEIKNGVDNDIRKVVVFFLIAYTLLLILFTKEKYKLYSQAIILVLLVAELSYFSFKSYEDRIPITKTEFNKDKAGYSDGTITAVNFLKNTDKSFFRIEKDYQSGSAQHGSLNDAWVQGYFGTGSYSSFNQLNYIRFQEKTGLIQEGDETASRWSAGFKGQPLLQTFGNVKYHLSKESYPPFLHFGFDSLTRTDNITILKNRFYLPFGYTYEKYISFESFEKLASYQLQQQSLLNIEREFAGIGEINDGKQILAVLASILNKNYISKDEYINELMNLTGKENFENYKHIILKHSSITFRRQLALLNAIIIEDNKEANYYNTNKLSELILNDSTIPVPENFNFEIYEQYINKLKQDTLQISKFSNSRIEGKIKLNKPKILFLTIPYDKGWKIELNGKQNQLLRVNFGFSGIVLPEGEHSIILYYEPQYSKITSVISLISITFFWLFLGYYIFKKRKTHQN